MRCIAVGRHEGTTYPLTARILYGGKDVPKPYLLWITNTFYNEQGYFKSEDSAKRWATQYAGKGWEWREVSPQS